MAHRTPTHRTQNALRTLLVALAAMSALTGCYELAPPPSTCTTEFAPVCGDDAVTYANTCMAEAAGAAVAHAGPCTTGNTCTSDTECDIGAICQFPSCLYPDYPDAGPGYPVPEPTPRCGDGTGTCEACVCATYYSPVCGADGITYGNECEASCAHTTVASSGACGTTCERLACPPIWCEYGYATDASGCPTCTCNPPPSCGPAPLCDPYCEFGVRIDARGCPTCECNPPPVCTGMVCPVYCEFGNVIDASGCPTCECNPPPTCSPVACGLYCEFGFARDSSGCEICACNPPPPPPGSLCSSDYECAPGNVCDFSMPVCAAPDCLPGSPCPPSMCWGTCLPSTTCVPVTCDLYCPYGFARDASGCETCACNPPPPPPPPPPPVRLCLDDTGCATYEYCDHSICFTAPGTTVCYGACFGGPAAADGGSSGGGSADAGVPLPR